MTKNKGRLFVLGIDGASFDIIEPLIKTGYLPNFKKLMEKGNTGIFKSIIPPLTAPAWASLQTGMNPGKHGIYDFTLLKGWNSVFVNSKELKEKPFWIYLSEKKIKSIIVNIPLTYPVYPINGIIVGGMETPSELHNYTFPLELKRELNEIGYVIEPNTYQKSYEEIVKMIMDSFEKRVRAVKFLMGKDWKFFLVLIRATDILQHYFWDKKPVRELYMKIDVFLGELIKRGFDLVVISDHGFEKLEKAININTWLVKNNYLVLKKERKGFLNKDLAYKLTGKLRLDFLKRVVPRKFKRFLREQIGFEEALSKNLIDWSKTKAIVKRSVKTINIYLNTKERSEKGVIEEKDYEKIREELILRLRDFFENEKIKVGIWKKEELYKGGALENAPDVVIYLPRGYESDGSMFSSDIYTKIPERNIAEHNLDGIIISNLKLKLKNASILDLAPTVLEYFNIDIKDKRFDGKSLL